MDSLLNISTMIPFLPFLSLYGGLVYVMQRLTSHRANKQNRYSLAHVCKLTEGVAADKK